MIAAISTGNDPLSFSVIFAQGFLPRGQLYLQPPPWHILGSGTQLHGGADGHKQVQQVPPNETHHVGNERARII
jgi:hypothetical protein